MIDQRLMSCTQRTLLDETSLFRCVEPEHTSAADVCRLTPPSYKHAIFWALIAAFLVAFGGWLIAYFTIATTARMLPRIHIERHLR